MRSIRRKRWARMIRNARPSSRGQQLGHHEHEPRCGEIDPGDVDDARPGMREDHPPHDGPPASAERVRRLDQLVRDRPRDVGHHQDVVEDRPDDDERDLRRLVDPEPDDQQGYERCGRDVPQESDLWFEERVHAGEAADEESERHPDQEADRIADHDPLGTGQEVRPQFAVAPHLDQRVPGRRDRRHREALARPDGRGENPQREDAGDPDTGTDPPDPFGNIAAEAEDVALPVAPASAGSGSRRVGRSRRIRRDPAG